MTAPLHETLDELCARHGVADLYAFGSRAAETAARLRGCEAERGPSGSDLDIGVRFTREAAESLGAGSLRRLDVLESLLVWIAQNRDLVDDGL